jgi:hypothetical protein
MMKKISVQQGAALLVMALVLGLLSACPNMLNRPDPRSSGEGLVQISLVTAGEGAASPSARTALPRAADLYYTLEFTKGVETVTKNINQAALTSVSLAEGTWRLEVTGYSDSGRTLAVVEGSVPTVTIPVGGVSAVTVELTGIVTTANGSISYAIQFPIDTNIGVLILNKYNDGGHYKTINLLGTDDGNSHAATGSVVTATGTINAVPAGYYQVLVQLANTTAHQHAVYTDLAHVYDNAETPVAKEFVAGDFSGYTPVTDKSLDTLVAPPGIGNPPNTTAINETEYTGTIAWKESDGTAVSGNFVAARVYKAVVTLSAKAEYSFAGLAANVFTYTGSPTAVVSNPAGTGATITVTISFPAPGLRYVKESPAGEGTGFSWGDASSDLQKMMDQAGADKVADNNITAIVRVAEGTYKPLYAPATDGSSTTDFATYATLTDRDKTFILRSGVEIRGGYPAAATDTTPDTERNWAETQTILSGDLDNDDAISTGDAYHVVLGVDIPAGSGTVLDGFTIKGGNADVDSAITVSGDSISSKNGGGMYIRYSSPKLTNVTIMGNSAVSDGGGIYNNNSSPILTNMVIAGNTAGSIGGGIRNLSSSPILTNVILSGNSVGLNGSGIYNADSSPVLTNVTIAGNKSPSSRGSIANFNSSSPKIRNSIIWGNTDGFFDSGSTPEVYHSIVQGGWTGTGSDNLGNIDPVFVLELAASNAPTTGGDYRLQSTSPAINKGSNTYYTSGTPDLSAITTDLDGENRIRHDTVDMGAYESEYDLVVVEEGFYVRETAAGSGNGSSWANASSDLQAMIDAAYTAGGGIVRVAAGTYKPLYAPAPDGTSTTDFVTYTTRTARDKTFILRPGVEILGGYIAAGEPISETVRKARFSATGEPLDEDYRAVLSGDLDNTNSISANDACHVVLGVDIPAGSGAVLDGLTISGGNANADTIITVEYKTIYRDSGGGMYNHNSSPVLANLTIKGNSATGSGTSAGGGMYNYNSSLALTNATVTGNSAGSGTGGGINNHTSSPVLTSVSITGNSASSGGGIHNDSSSSPVLTNVSITGNAAASFGGGIANNSSSPVLTNVTIAGNSAPNSTSGGGIYNVGASSAPKIRNTIISGNSTGLYGEGLPEVFYSIVQGSSYPLSDPDSSSNYNLRGDPQFVSLQGHSSAPTTAGDYRLKNGSGGAEGTTKSPAIDRGYSSLYPNTWAKWQTQIGGSAITQTVYETYVLPALSKDAGGATRMQGAAIDMGAYEKQ